jgi:hypothetical protein
VPARGRPLNAVLHLHLLHVRADEEADDPADPGPDQGEFRVLLDRVLPMITSALLDFDVDRRSLDSGMTQIVVRPSQQ